MNTEIASHNPAASWDFGQHLWGMGESAHSASEYYERADFVIDEETLQRAWYRIDAAFEAHLDAQVAAHLNALEDLP